MRPILSLLHALILLPVICSVVLSYPRVETGDVVAGLNDPLSLAVDPDGGLWLLERGGSVFRVDPEKGKKVLVLNLPGLVESRGAYGMTIDRDFSDSSWLYFYYPITNSQGWTEGRVSRFRYDRGLDSLVDQEDIMAGLFTVQWSVGGGMTMLPDRTILFGTGDGIDYFADAQKHESMAGKVFRIGSDGSVPDDNPWPDAPFPANMLWATGFSNVSDIILGPDDVVYSTEKGSGGLSDEINVLMKGRNYGWWPVRGFCDLGSEEERCGDSNAVNPLYEWYRGRGGGVVPTGIVWFDQGKISEWNGSFLVTTEKDGLWQVVLRDDGRGTAGIYHYLYSTDDLDAYGDLRDIALTADGRIFVAVRDLAGEPGADRIVELLSVDFQPLSDGVAEIVATEITDGLAAPQQVAWGPENMLWVAERGGRIARVNPESGAIASVADVSTMILDIEEGGLRGLLLHPDFPDSSWVYISYVTASDGNPDELRLARGRYDDESGLISGEWEVLLEGIPAGAGRNGGRLGRDQKGMILLGTGDAGLAELAGDRWGLNGKILRLTPEGGVPDDNPYADREVPEAFIWSRGLRDPAGLLLSDAGLIYGLNSGESVDELELIMPGRHYGWPEVDGYCDNSPFPGEADACRALDIDEPMRTWQGVDGLSGAAWYGASRIPLWNNSILVTTRGSGELLQVRLEADGRLLATEDHYVNGEFGRLGTVVVSPDGGVFITTSNTPAGGEGIDRLIRIDGVPDVTLGDESKLEIRTVVEGLDTPWEVVWGPDDWLWITERFGQISRVSPETGKKHLILDIGDDVFEFAGSGMLGMTLHPDFDANPWLYVVYTYRVNPGSSDLLMFERLSRFEYDQARDTLVNEVVLIDSIEANIYHDGSRLLVLPDNTLLMTTGDAANRDLPQDHTKLNGKVLRINLDGTVPADNPWPDAPWPGNILWSTGHRNAQGLTISPDGTLYSSEHGDDTDDEVNIVMKGRNYGYPFVHGYCDDTVFFRYTPEESQFCADSNVVEPIRSWTPTLGVCGLVYYDHDTIPEWTNSLLLVTLGIKKPVLPLYANALIQMKLSPDGQAIVDEKHYFLQQFGRLRAICLAPDGRVFIASSNEDTRGEPRPGGDRIVEIRPRRIASVETPIVPMILPNPILDEGEVRFGVKLGEGRVRLFDAVGRQLRDDPFAGGDRYRFYRGSLPVGVYFLKVSPEGEGEGEERIARIVLY